MTPPYHLSWEKWRFPLQASMTTDQLLLAVAAYFSAWTVQDLNRIPPGLAFPIRTIEDLHIRAIEASHAEVSFKGAPDDWVLCRELALVIAGAAARARYLESLKVH